MRFAVIIERAGINTREAIAFQQDGLREDGLPIPQPSFLAEYADTDAA